VLECVSDGDGIDDNASAAFKSVAAVWEDVGEGKECNARDACAGSERSTVVEDVAVGGFSGTLA
jgi:hypothetical protein